MHKKRKKIIMITTVLLVSIILLFLSFFFTKNDYSIERILKDVGLFIGNISSSIFNSSNNDCDVTSNEELEYQLNILKETLDLNNTLNESKKINALIINRDLSIWNESITLNKGMKDGVEVGDAVVMNKGLVGKIISVSNYNSICRLLTSEASNKISVKIKTNDDYAYGLLTNYDSNKNIYNLEGISETIDIEIGAIVTTTGIGNNFPSGIIVGNVKNITTDNYDLAKLIEVTPSVQFDALSIVTILNRNEKE